MTRRLTALLALAALATIAALAGCGGGGDDEPTYDPAAVIRCLRIEQVTFGAEDNEEVFIDTGTKREYDPYSTPHYSTEPTSARATLFVRPDLAREALKSGPGRAFAAFVPSGWANGDHATLAEVVGRSGNGAQVDLLFFGSPESAEDAEAGADDQARALERITIAEDTGTAKDVNTAREALREAGGPTVERDGNLLKLWRTEPTDRQDEIVSGCLDRVQEDQT